MFQSRTKSWGQGGVLYLVLKCKYILCFDFQDLGAGDPIMLIIFMIFWGLKIMGACGWLFCGFMSCGGEWM